MAYVDDNYQALIANDLVKLANERSRFSYALRLTWDALGIPSEVQIDLIEKVRGGNEMDNFKLAIESEVTAPRLI